MTDRATLTIDVHLDAADLDAALRADVTRGLTSSPKGCRRSGSTTTRGSELFDEITRLPEYYPTRREREILAARGRHHRRRRRAPTRSSSWARARRRRPGCCSTRWAASGRLRRFVPFDVSEATLRRASAAVAAEYPGIEVHAVVGDFERHLEQLPGGGRRLRGLPRRHHRQPRSRPSGPRSWPGCGPRWRRATRCCSAPTW